jgi:methionyl-tRNA formyltransferase
VPIAADDTSASLTPRLAALGAQMLVPALQDLARGTLPPRPQPAEGVVYAHKIDKAEAAIDWRLPAAQIERRVRAFDPFPGASFGWQGETLKLWRAACVDAPPALPGTLLPAGPDRLRVACGEGALDLLELQRPGGRRQPAALLRAWAEAAGLVPGQCLPAAG